MLALVLVAFPVPSARATQCDDVLIYWEYGGPTGLLVGMDTDTPASYTIFYTTNGTTPTHNGSTPGTGTAVFTNDYPVPYGSWRYFRAICYKDGYDDSNMSSEDISNPIQ